MIYTSYFAKYKGKDGVSIATKQPPGCNFPVFQPLVPELDLVWGYKRGQLTEEEYKNTYFKQLSTLDVQHVAKALENKVLLCWEGSDKFCHRHLVAEWLNSHGILCKEQHLTEMYFEPEIIPETCLYCTHINLKMLPNSFTFVCENKKSKHYQKKTKMPQRSTCKRWESKF